MLRAFLACGKQRSGCPIRNMTAWVRLIYPAQSARLPSQPSIRRQFPNEHDVTHADWLPPICLSRPVAPRYTSVERRGVHRNAAVSTAACDAFFNLLNAAGLIRDGCGRDLHDNAPPVMTTAEANNRRHAFSLGRL